MSVTLPKYKELLEKKKDIDTELLPERLGKAHAEVMLGVAQVKEDLKTRQLSFKEACMATPLNPENLIKLMNEIDTVKRKLGQYENIVSQMFDA